MQIYLKFEIDVIQICLEFEIYLKWFCFNILKYACNQAAHAGKLPRTLCMQAAWKNRYVNHVC